MKSLVFSAARRKRRMHLAVINLSAYGISHAVVDAACAALVMSHLPKAEADLGYFALLVMIYNALAFAGQPLIGLISDRLRLSKATAVLGCLLTAAAMFIYSNPALSVVIAGIGNAMFHVGGGIICLNLYKGKATPPGIFVAPGVIGLTIGTLVGKSGSFSAATFAFLLLLCGEAIFFLQKPRIDYVTHSEIRFEPYNVIVMLLLGSICIRALVGFIVNFSWKTDILLLIVLTIAVALGKGLGGLLGDKLGWQRVSVAGLLLSAPLIAFGSYPVAGIAGMFLFNLTMPVTLAAVSNLLPGFPGFAFGMTTLALETGVLVSYLPFSGLLSNSWIVLFIILASAVMLNKSLGLYFNDSSKIKIKRININMKGE